MENNGVYWDHFNEHYVHNTKRNYLEGRHLLPFLLDFLNNNKNIMDICDVGCACGALLYILRDKYEDFDPSRYFGVDLSKVNIASAKKLAPEANFKYLDITTDNLKGRFDVIFSGEMLSHISLKNQLITIEKLINSARRCCLFSLKYTNLESFEYMHTNEGHEVLYTFPNYEVITEYIENKIKSTTKVKFDKKTYNIGFLSEKYIDRIGNLIVEIKKDDLTVINPIFERMKPEQVGKPYPRDVFLHKRIAIFGGTGSLGTVLTEGLLQEKVDKIYLICNNENELWESKNHFKNNEKLEFLFCDIRNYVSLEKLFHKETPDIVFNCAALKHVGYCEQFPFEAVQTNLLGLENLLLASQKANIEKFIQVSTDKAVESIGVMGASKFIGEQMCKSYNEYYMNVSCIRMGNVLNSRGSLIPQLYKDIENYGKVFITDTRMERFFISKKDVWIFIKKVIKNMQGGEIFIPKLELKLVIDVIDKILGENKIVKKFIGKQKGEKLKEKLYSEYENVEELDWCWKIR